MTWEGGLGGVLSAHLVINLTDSRNRRAFALAANIKDDPMDMESMDTHKDEVDL